MVAVEETRIVIDHRDPFLEKIFLEIVFENC